MKKIIAFFGHSKIGVKNIREKLKNAVEANLCEEVYCLVGTHGDYDELAISVCRELKKVYTQMKIIMVFSSVNILKNNCREIYEDVETMIYDIEQEHFKKRIIVSNRCMVNDCDMVICYVDMKKYGSGAKQAVEYAMKRGKDIINLFQE